MLHAAVTAHLMPFDEHAKTPEESEMVHSNGCLGTFVLPLHGSSTAAYAEETTSKESFEDREDGGELELATPTLHLLHCMTVSI